MSAGHPESELLPLIRRHTGPVHVVRRTERGFSSDLTALVECREGLFFVKAVRNRPGGRRDSLRREAVVNPYVRPLSPPLRWRAEDDDWAVLGFEAVTGRTADLSPGSPDLPAAVELVGRIGKLDLPEVAWWWTETRWDRFAADPVEAELFRGDNLLHTDINPGNLIVGERRMWAVDWAWPTRGAGFIDPALLALQLVSAGHSPQEAETWASGCEAWATAPSRAVDAFASASARMYQAFAERRPGELWLEAMVAAAREWVGYRRGRS